MSIRRLTLNNTLNTRELGGYENNKGFITKYNKFLRSDDVSCCDEDDMRKLEHYGVKTIIDLRSVSETSKIPSNFAKCEKFNYYHLPLIQEKDKDKNYIKDLKGQDLKKLYIEILNNFDGIYKLFSIILENKNNGILYHCIVGKDRTGITTMLLFLLADLYSSDIIADYEVTFTYIKPLIEIIKKEHPDMPMHIIKSDSENMEETLKYFYNEFKTVENYFSKVGFEEEEIFYLKNLLF